jgi:hypothetical protein
MNPVKLQNSHVYGNFEITRRIPNIGKKIPQLTIMEYLKKNRFLLFLMALFLTIAYPLFSKDPKVLDLYATMTYSLILASGMWAFSRQRSFLAYSSAFFILAILIEWLQYFTENPFFDNFNPISTSVVLILLLVMTLKSVVAATEIGPNVIYGVVAGYVLIGFVGGLLAIAIALGYPGAFNLAEPITPPEAMYFSFVTMTTLGYGDIAPAIQETRSLSIILSIVGPMYVAIVIALMVGKFAASKNN